LPTDTRLNFPGNVHTGTPVFYGATFATIGPPEAPHLVTLKDGTKWKFNSPNGRLIYIEDRHNNKLTLSRPDGLNATQIQTPDGRVVGIEFDSQNRITRLTGPLDQTVTYTYTAQGDLETVTDPMGGVTRYTYNNHNLLTIQTPRNIVKYTNTYDPAEPDPTKKRVTAQQQVDGGTWQFSYQTIGSTVTQTTVTDPRGKTRTYAIENGYITRITNHLGQPTTFTREAGTNFVTRIQDHLQRRKDITYDTKKNVQTITQYKDPPPPLPGYTQPVTHTFTYDLTYNLLTQYKDPLNHIWGFGLDAAKKNVIGITNPLLKTWTITPNSAGQVERITDPLAYDTHFTYNSYGLLESVRDHLNNTATYTYDALGRRIAATDPRGYTTQFAYDLLNRLTAVANPLGQAVQFEYDPNSNLIKVKDARGGEITYQYDNMDRLFIRQDQLTRTETYTYDLQGGGTLVSFRDRKNRQATWDPYDDLNRPTVARFHNSAGTEVSTITYHYDAANRLDELNDSPAGTITRIFDALDRMTQEQTPQGVITYGYDDANRRSSMTVAGQPDVTYLWDNANRLQTITRQGSPALIATYAYDDANRRTQLILPNSVTIDYTYDLANRLTGLTYSGVTGGPFTLTYAYDAAGNRVRIGGSWARTLLPAAISTASYDAANRQLTLGGKTMVYDNNGNLATLTESSQTTTYTWDARDRLIGVTGPGLSASFTYDGDSRRTQKTINAFGSTFQYDNLDIIKEVAGGQTVNYLRSLETDETLARIEDGGAFCYAPDALGSTLALADGTGGISTEYTYEPFGITTFSEQANQNAFEFTGRENDGSGLYYYRARYYEPRLGRFAREDPLGVDG
jgi:RHS repeat-associated protein